MKVSGVFRNADATIDVADGEIVFEQGDAGAEMYGIVEGAVELTSNGRVVAKLGPDDVFGELAIIDGSPRMATARAVAPTQLAAIDRRRFLFLVHETPTFAIQVMTALAERLRALPPA